jgi:hypothetical protein
MVNFPHDIPAPAPPILSPNRWKRLSQLSGLPDNAKDDVERAINYFRLCRMAAEGTKLDKFERVAADLSRASKSLRDFKNDDDAFWTLVVSRSELEENVEKRKALRRDLTALADKIESGLKRVAFARPRRGRRGLRADVYVLIRQLNFIAHEWTDTDLSYSTKRPFREFLIEVCKEVGIKESMVRSVTEGIRREDRDT